MKTIEHYATAQNPPCKCGDLKSHHLGGTGAATDPGSRCAGFSADPKFTPETCGKCGDGREAHRDGDGPNPSKECRGFDESARKAKGDGK